MYILRLLKNKVYFRLGLLSLRRVEVDADITYETVSGYVRNLGKNEAAIYREHPPISGDVKTTVYAVYWLWLDTRIRIYYNSLFIQYMSDSGGFCHSVILTSHGDPKKAAYIGNLGLRSDSSPHLVAAEVMARKYIIRGISDVE